MKKFVFIYCGDFKEPSEEIMQKWMQWFVSFEDKTIDSGNPFSKGMNVKNGKSSTMQQTEEVPTGYTIIEVEDINEALEIAKRSPHIGNIQVMETLPM